MKISYTGKSEEIPARQRTKLEARLQKLSKVLEQRGEKEAHVVLTQQRFLHKVEITIHAWDHALVGIATNGDIAVAAHEAFDRLEKQLLKLRARWRDTRRVRDKEADGEKASASLQAVAPVSASSKKAKPAKAGRQREEFHWREEGRAQAGVSRQSLRRQQADDAGRSDARNGGSARLPGLPRRAN